MLFRVNMLWRGQPVPAARAIVDCLKGSLFTILRRRAMKHKQGKFGGKIPPKNELPGIRAQKTGSSTGKSESI